VKLPDCFLSDYSESRFWRSVAGSDHSVSPATATDSQLIFGSASESPCSGQQCASTSRPGAFWRG